MSCSDCDLLDAKREQAYIHRERVEGQFLSAGPNWTNSLADAYAKALAECDTLYSAYRAHQKIRHGVEVNYANFIETNHDIK